MSDKRPVGGAPTDVEWLREVVGYLRSVEADHEADRVAEAADEIERLRRDREQDAATVLAYSEQCDKWQTEVERLRAAIQNRIKVGDVGLFMDMKHRIQQLEEALDRMVAVAETTDAWATIDMIRREVSNGR